MNDNHPYTEQQIQFVASHYKPNAFDSRKGWEKMQQRIGAKKDVRSLVMFYRVAAAVAIIAAIGTVYFMTNQSETLVAKTDYETYTLPDNSRVDMRKGSELTYDKKFGDAERRVAMRGEISFDVERDETKPFIVTAPTAEICVLGTEFTVREDDKNVTLNVSSGLVQFTPNDPSIPILCAAGAEVHYTANTKRLEVTKPNGSMIIDGSQKTLSFTNALLKDVVRVLSHYFNTSIQLPEEESEITFTSSFTDKSVIEIINIINLTLDTRITLTKQP